jgi:hypothetical protein
MPYFSACTAAGHAIQSKDPFAGKLEGAYIYPSTIDEKGSRVTSATAYCEFFAFLAINRMIQYTFGIC